MLHSIFAFKNVLETLVQPSILRKPLVGSTFIDKCIIPTIKLNKNKKEFNSYFFDLNKIQFFTRILQTEEFELFYGVIDNKTLQENKLPEKMTMANLLHDTVITANLPNWYNANGKDPYLYDKKIFIITSEYLLGIESIDDSLEYIWQLMKKIFIHLNKQFRVEPTVLYDVIIKDEEEYYKMATLWALYDLFVLNQTNTDIEFNFYDDCKFAQDKFESEEAFLQFIETLKLELE